MSYEIALDIGTTNIQALLIDASSKRQVDYLSAKNSQAIYGEDIITRLGLSLKNKILQKKINKSILDDIALLLNHILKRSGIESRCLKNVTACSNAAMHHIVLKLPLESLARAPFRASSYGNTLDTSLKRIGIDFPEEKSVRLRFLPNLGGFVGSDALCVIENTGIYKSKKTILAIDLGTNGEIILGSEKKILVASTSAGPAFGGWHIKCGLHGSTLIDVIADLLKDGIIDKTGFMKKSLYVYKKGSDSVTVTQKDVREFQLAKAAVLSGINLLRKRLGVKKPDKVFIAGLFGSKINRESAKIAGILPDDIDFNKVNIKQNSALLGAKALMLSKGIKTRLKSIIRITEHVELHKEPDFQEEFTRAMHF